MKNDSEPLKIARGLANIILIYVEIMLTIYVFEGVRHCKQISVPVDTLLSVKTLKRGTLIIAHTRSETKKTVIYRI